jgi:hypothetical protein
LLGITYLCFQPEEKRTLNATELLDGHHGVGPHELVGIGQGISEVDQDFEIVDRTFAERERAGAAQLRRGFRATAPPGLKLKIGDSTQVGGGTVMSELSERFCDPRFRQTLWICLFRIDEEPVVCSEQIPDQVIKVEIRGNGRRSSYDKIVAVPERLPKLCTRFACVG